MPTAPLLFARRRAATAATVPVLIPVPVPRSGLARTVAHRSVNRNARTAVGAWPRTLVSARPSGTGTIVGCLYVIKVNLKLMARRKRVLEYQKVIPRSVWMYDQERGPCTGRASLKNGATRRKASTAPSRNELTPSWRPSPVRTIYMLPVFVTDLNVVIPSK